MTGEENRDNGTDDMACRSFTQTFLIEEEDGCFITKMIFFQLKDDVLPTWVEIRNVVNGYPGPKFYLLVENYYNHLKLTVSDDGQSQPFVFDSPVFLQQGNEYCIVLRTPV